MARVLVGELCDERFQRILKLAGRLLLLRRLLLVLVLHAHRDRHEVVEQHGHAHLQHHPHADDDEAASEDGRLPFELAVGPERGQRVDPRVARRDAEERDEGAVELAELVRRDLCKERNPEYGIWEGMRRSSQARPGKKISLYRRALTKEHNEVQV